MFWTIVAVLTAPIVAVGVMAATRPNSFRVERRTRIDAPPERVFALLDDFHQWGQWSPWEKLDPTMTRTHGGPERGVGATYAWTGNKKVGQGRMEILEATSPSKVSVRLEFLAPWKATNTAEFLLTPAGSGTDVVWAMFGPSPFMMKVMGLFMPIDKMVGKDFEAGLANMKRAAERHA